MLTTVLIAVALCLIFIGSARQSPAIAETLAKIPLIGSVFLDSDRERVSQASERGLSTKVDDTKESNGLTVTLEEVLYDENWLSLSFNMQVDDAVELAGDYSRDISFYVDGDKFEPISSSSTFNNPTENEYSQFTQIESEADLPDEFELKVELTIEDELFAFTHEVQKRASEQVHVDDRVIEADGVTIELEKLTLSPSSLELVSVYRFDESLPKREIGFVLAAPNLGRLEPYMVHIKGVEEDQPRATYSFDYTGEEDLHIIPYVTEEGSEQRIYLQPVLVHTESEGAN